MHRRSFLKSATAAVALTTLGRPALASGYPERAVTLWVPYAVGGNADLTARLFADALSGPLGQTVVVGNKAGGGGAIGATHIISSRPDGYNLLFSAPSVFSVIPHLTKVSYDWTGIRPVAFVSKTPLVLVVRKSSQYTSLKGVIEAARATHQGVAMGYSGLGTPNHLAMLNLESIAQVRFNGIAYKGSGPMLQDILAGHIELAADQYSTSRPYIESGDLVPIAVFGEALAALPGIPTVSTLGPEPFDVTTYLGISAPSATPDTVVSRLQEAIRIALADARFKEGMERMGSQIHLGTAAEFSSTMQKEEAFMKQMIASGRVALS